MIDEQFRIYRLRAGELELIATCGSNEAVGTAIVTLGEEGEFDDCTIGVMHRPFDDKPGTWLANPFPPSRDIGKRSKRRRLESKRTTEDEMIEIVRERATPGAVRVMLAMAGINVTAAVWPEPGFVVAAGQTYAPTLLRGTLLVDGVPRYSAAWL